MTVLMGDTRNIALTWHKTPNFITNCRGNITGAEKYVKTPQKLPFKIGLAGGFF
jgi:hypothetical protein